MITVNGEQVEGREGASVADLLSALGVGPHGRGVAVAVNGEVVPRSAWDQTRVAAGDRVEAVGAIQGG